MTSIPFTLPDGPSPVEQRALAHVSGMEQMTALMTAQHLKGHEEYGHPIDDWKATRHTALTEAGKEACDLLTYLERAGDVPWELMSHARQVAHYLNLLLRSRY